MADDKQRDASHMRAENIRIQQQYGEQYVRLRTTTRGPSYHCGVCDVLLPQNSRLQLHYQGSMHLNRLEELRSAKRQQQREEREKQVSLKGAANVHRSKFCRGRI